MSNYQKQFSAANGGESLFSRSAKKFHLIPVLVFLVVFQLWFLSSAALAQSQTLISPSSQNFPAVAINEGVVRDFKVSIAQGEFASSVEICVPNCTYPTDSIESNVFPIGEGSADDASGGASWRFQYNCPPADATAPQNCDAQVVFVPSIPGTYDAEFRVNSKAVFIGVLTNTKRSTDKSVFDQTGSAQLTGILVVPPERGIVQFNPTNYPVNDDDGTVELTIERIDGSDGAVSVVASTEDGSAQSGSDYEAFSGSLAWGDGEMGPKTFTVQIVADTSEEQDPTEVSKFFTVLLSAGSRADSQLIGDDSRATVTINNVPPLPTGRIQFDQESYTVAEEAQSITVNLDRVGGSRDSLNVDYFTADGSAQAGLDYTGLSGGLGWENGDSERQTLTIPILTDDNSEEGNEDFFIELSNGERARIVITDDQPVSRGLIQFNPVSYNPTESTGILTIVATRTGGNDGKISVQASTLDGSAEAGSDYSARTVNLVWEDNDSEDKTFTVPILSDDVEESTESFSILFLVSNSDDQSLIGANDVATVNITDVAPDERGTIQFVPENYEVSEIDGEVTLTMTRVGGNNGSISVFASTTDGSAEAGSDYADTRERISWANNDGEPKTVTVAILTDSADEADEEFSVLLTDASDTGESVIGTTSRATVTIADAAPPNAGTLTISQEEYSTTEEAGSVTIIVNRIDGDEGAVSVQFQTANDSAEAGLDFTAVSGELNWADGDTLPKQFTVQILDDNESEESEIFTVTLLNPQTSDNAVPRLSRSTAIVTIEDSTNVGQLRFVSVNYSGSEADGQVVLDVERFGGDDGFVSVDYRLVGDSALAGVDFIADTGTLSWNDGETGIRTIEVQILEDFTNEAPEFLRAVLENAVPIGAAQLTTAETSVEITSIPPDDTPTSDYQLDIVSGDNQSILPGDPLEPLVLQVSLMPSATGPTENLTINWRVQPVGSAELENGNQTLTDGSGQASNQISVISRGFVRVIASVVEPEVTGSTDRSDLRILPPPIELRPDEIAFTVRAGLFAAVGLNDNQAQTGRALDAACDALDDQVETQNALTAGQQDLLSTCRELETRLSNGTLAMALDRLAPEEIFTLGDSVIDTTDLQITNVYSRINAIRSGRTDSLDISGLNINVHDQNIPGSVFESAQNQLFSGGSASGDNTDLGSRLSVFVNGSLSVGKVDGDLNQRSADISTNGVTVGMDYRLTANSVVGTGIGIMNNTTDFSPDDGGVDTSAVNLTLYGTYYREAAAYVDVVLDIGRNQFDVRRRIDLPGNDRRFAFGDTSADVIALTMGAGFDKAIGSFEFGPYGRLSFINADVGSYKEQAETAGEGIGSVLAIKAHSVQSTTASIGAQLSRIISTKYGVFIPQLRIEAEFESVDKKDGIQATFQHDPSQSTFEIAGNPRDKSYINIGLGSSVLLPNGKTGFIFYETRTQHDFVTQDWLKLGVRIEF